MSNKQLFVCFVFLSTLMYGQNFFPPTYSLSLNHAPNCYVDSVVLTNGGPPYEKIVNTYDNKWRLTKSHRTYYQNKYETFIYTYDSNDSLIRKEKILGEPGFQTSELTVMTRNQLKQIASDSLLYKNGPTYTLQSTNTFTYDAAGYVIGVTWFDNQGVPGSRGQYTRNSTGKFTKLFFEEWVSNAWQTSYIETHTYNSSGLLTEQHNQYWNSVTVSFQYKARHVYTGSHLDTTVHYTGVPNMEVYSRDRFSAAGNTDTMFTDHWTGTKFIELRRYERSMSQGRLTSLVMEDLDKGVWTYVRKYEYTYAPDGTHTLTKDWLFDVLKQQWGPTDFTNFYYSCDLTRTGLSEEPITKLRIYPVPTNSLLQIESDKTIIKGEVINTSGQTLIHFEGASVDLSSIPQGVYFVKVTFSDGTGAVVKAVRE